MFPCALLQGSPASFPGSWQPLICFLSVAFSCLDLHINGIMSNYVVTPVWRHSLSTVLLRFIYVVTWTTGSFFFFFLNSNLCMNTPQFAYLFNSWWKSGMCSVFWAIMKKAAINISEYKSLLEYIFSPMSWGLSPGGSRGKTQLLAWHVILFKSLSLSISPTVSLNIFWHKVCSPFIH